MLAGVCEARIFFPRSREKRELFNITFTRFVGRENRRKREGKKTRGESWEPVLRLFGNRKKGEGG